MQPVKRIEIVIPEHALRDLLAVISRSSPGDYTVFRGLGGRGDRGIQSGDGVVGEFSNAAVLMACDEAQAGALLEDLRALLRQFGGMCLVSDANWLKH